MKDIVLEQFCHILVNIAQDAVDVIVDGIQLATRRFDAIILPGLLIEAEHHLAKAVLFTPLPSAAHMGRSIELGQHQHTAHFGVVDDIADVVWSIDLPKMGTKLFSDANMATVI